jgi:hypothetical protein
MQMVSSAKPPWKLLFYHIIINLTETYFEYVRNGLNKNMTKFTLNEPLGRNVPLCGSGNE